MTRDGADRRHVGGGRFELVERLGTGAMGTVWRAVDTTLHREIALKEVRAPLDAPDDEIARLQARVLREARALARLRNPHVATVHQIVEDDPYPWIAMELVPGRPLTSLLAEGTLTPREAAGIGADILDALGAAHGAGVLHRDVKPANVVVRPDGSAVLVDFGVAAVEGAGTLAGMGSFVGTVEYIAPERTEGRRPTPAADLWSLGVLLYVAVEGHSPFRRPDHWETLAAIVNDPHPPPRKAGHLTGVIDALLTKDPQARPSSADLAGPLAEIAGRGGVGRTASAGTAGASGVGDPGGVPGRVGDPGRVPGRGDAGGPATADAPTLTAGGPPHAAAAGTGDGSGVPHGPHPSPGPVTHDPLPGPGSPGPRRASGRTRRIIAAVAIGVVLAGGGTALGLVLAGDDSTGGSGANPPTASPPATANTGTGTGTSPTDPAASGAALPAGYQLQSHADGFEVAVPVGWTLGKADSDAVAYTSPDGNHRLVVRVLRGDTADPYAEQSASARETAASAAYPGYRQIELARGSHGGGKSASWEYTYNSSDGPRHIKDVRWQVGGNSYNLWTAVPDGPSWAQYEEQLRIALEHFRDTRAG